MNELNIKMSVQELNTVLEALGNQPYLQVFELISKLHIQAQEQLKAEPETKRNGKQSTAEVIS